MRTTIDLSDEQRSHLRKLALQRGEKGISAIVQEALEHYLGVEEREQSAKDRALAALGSLSDEAADRLEDDVRRLRWSWR